MDILSWVNLGVSCTFAAWILSQRSQSKRDWHFAATQTNLDRLLRYLEIEYIDISLEPVKKYLLKGEKLQAIIAFRELNPTVSIKEATYVVDTLDRELHQQHVH